MSVALGKFNVISVPVIIPVTAGVVKLKAVISQDELLVGKVDFEVSFTFNFIEQDFPPKFISNAATPSLDGVPEIK